MKQINLLLLIFCAALLPACDSNKKLDQSNSEKVIREFVQNNAFNGGGNWGQQGSFNESSITSIEPISQFSETDASQIVHFNYRDAFAGENLSIKFNFKKNIDKHWMLISVTSVAGVGSDGMANRLQKWENLNTMTQ